MLRGSWAFGQQRRTKIPFKNICSYQVQSRQSPLWSHWSDHPDHLWRCSHCARIRCNCSPHSVSTFFKVSDVERSTNLTSSCLFSPAKARSSSGYSACPAELMWKSRSDKSVYKRVADYFSVALMDCPDHVNILVWMAPKSICSFIPCLLHLISLIQLHCTESSKFPAFPSAQQHWTEWWQQRWWRRWRWRGEHCVDLGWIMDLAAVTTVSSPCAPPVLGLSGVPQSFHHSPSPSTADTQHLHS